jgi:hypothetical protein
MSIEKVNIKQKLSQFQDHWNPRVIGELNGQHVKAVKAERRVRVAPSRP